MKSWGRRRCRGSSPNASLMISRRNGHGDFLPVTRSKGSKRISFSIVNFTSLHETMRNLSPCLWFTFTMSSWSHYNIKKFLRRQGKEKEKINEVKQSRRGKVSERIAQNQFRLWDPERVFFFEISSAVFVLRRKTSDSTPTHTKGSSRAGLLDVTLKNEIEIKICASSGEWKEKLFKKCSMIDSERIYHSYSYDSSSSNTSLICEGERQWKLCSSVCAIIRPELYVDDCLEMVNRRMSMCVVASLLPILKFLMRIIQLKCPAPMAEENENENFLSLHANHLRFKVFESQLFRPSRGVSNFPSQPFAVLVCSV